MPLVKQLYTALPIYDSITKQNRYKHFCDNMVWKMEIPSNKLPEFAYLRETNPVFTFTLYAKDLEGNIIDTFTAGELSPLLNIETYTNGTELVTLNSSFDSFGSSEQLPNGDYYLEMTDGVDTYYSEVFSYTGFDSEDRTCYSRLMVVNNCQINEFYPQFTQNLYIQNDIGLPEYVETELNHETIENQVVVDFRKIDKTRKFFLYGPEYLCDFFSLISMMDQVVFYSQNETIEIENALCDITWEETTNCEARINVTFTVTSATKNTCCDPMQDLNIETPESVNVVAKVNCSEGTWPTGYAPSGGGADVPFVTGDLVLGCCDGNCFIYKYVNGLFVSQPQLNIQYTTVFDENEAEYWYYYSGGFNVPYLYLYFVEETPLNGVWKGNAPDGFMCLIQRWNGSSWDDVTPPDVVTSEVFSTTGFATESFGTYTYRVKVYNHSQTAYTNEVTLT